MGYHRRRENKPSYVPSVFRPKGVLMPRLERDYKPKLHKRIEKLLPGCVIIINDEQTFQGIPDTLILYRDRWAMLEVKRSANAERRPNQPYWVAEFDEMSFAAFICPENEEEVLHDLQQALRAPRTTRLSQS